MKLQTKKIIAREFLILTFSIVIGLLGLLASYPYNYLKKNKIEKLNKSILQNTKIADSLCSSYNSKTVKQNWFFRKQLEKFGKDTAFNTSDKLWKIVDDLAQKDSIKYKWDKIWDKELISFLQEIGFSNGHSFNLFINSNRITATDVQNYNISIKLNQEINALKIQKETLQRSILSLNQQFELGFKCFLVASFLLFFLRYVYYGIRWSIRILKQQSE